MKTSVVISILAAWLVCPFRAAASDVPEDTSQARPLFEQAQKLMLQKDYSTATSLYNQLINAYPDSPSRDVYYYALARAQYLSDDFKQADQTLTEFQTLFPQSNLLPYTFQLMGNVKYRQKNLDAAFKSFVQACRMTDDIRLQELSEQSLMTAIDAGYIPPDSLLSLVPKGLICRVKSRVMALMAEAWSERQIDGFMAECPRSIVAEVNRSKLGAGRLTIGVILPLTGPYAKYGQSILDGARLAMDRLASDGITIELLACNDRADNVTAAREALVLADAKVDVIIGPLLSNVAATAAAALSCRDIPLLVPAATQAGFTDLSPACFQLLPNLETVGRGMAQYAVKYRKMKTLAVMTPATPDETAMAESFSTEAKRLGANVLAIERFHPDETDFGPFLLDIKKLLLGRTGDSTVYISLDNDTLTFEEAPVSFDGMFLPLSQQQLFLLLPQLEYYRIMTSYLGTDEWNSPKILRLGQRILRDPVFYSGKAAMRFSDRYPSFADACRARFGSEPDYLTALGYDAVLLAADALKAGRQAPLGFADYLQAVSGFEGVSGRMTFGPAHSNLELPLFTLRNGLLSPVNEWTKVEPVAGEPTPDEPTENDDSDQEEPQPQAPDQ